MYRFMRKTVILFIYLFIYRMEKQMDYSDSHSRLVCPSHLLMFYMYSFHIEINGGLIKTLNK